MARISTEAKVGIFVLAGLAVLAYMSIRLGSFSLGEPQGYRIWAVFQQATGLRKDAPVEMAGIPIGKVERIELYGGKAKLVMFIDQKVKLPADSAAFIRTRGVLGDKYVSIEMGSPGAPLLTDGQRLVRAEVPTDLDRLMARMGQIADNVKVLTDSLKVSLGSPESQANIKESLANLREITFQLKQVVSANQDRLNRTLENFDRFASDLREISSDNKAALGQTVRSFRNAGARLDRLLANMGPKLDRTIASLASLAEKIDRGQGTLGALVNERKTIDELNQTLASLKSITRKVDEGKGTIGKLINDDTTVTKIDEALTGINDYLSRGDAWKVSIDYRGEYLFRETALRNTFNLRLQPKADKFYILGIQTDPVGRRTEKETITTVWENGVSHQRREKVVTIDKDEIKFNAMIGKRFHDLTARAGLIASSGGFGLDYHMLNDDLTLTFEAYDFRQDENPHLRVALDYKFWNYFYLTVGYDDFISQQDHDTVFMGMGINFFDDDLKFLLTKAPAP